MRTRGPVWLSAFLIVWLGSPALRAQTPPEAGKAYFERGVKQYNLGRFPEAIAEFEKAYDLDPVPILLFNIAQSHRQIGDKERALFFYRRYLEQAPDAPNRGEVEQRMKDLAQSLQEEKELKQKPPTEVASAGQGMTGGPTQTTVTKPSPVPAGSRLWSVGAAAALSFATVSGRSIDLPLMFALRAGAARTFPIAPGRLMIGVDGVLAILPYTTVDAAARESTSSLPGFMISGRYLVDVSSQIAVGGEVGGGVIWWTGLGAANPFSDPGVVITGAIPMPSFWLGPRAEFSLRPDLYFVLAPNLLYSKTTSGLGDSVSALWRLDVSLGAGYRF